MGFHKTDASFFWAKFGPKKHVKFGSMKPTIYYAIIFFVFVFKRYKLLACFSSHRTLQLNHKLVVRRDSAVAVLHQLHEEQGLVGVSLAHNI